MTHPNPSLPYFQKSKESNSPISKSKYSSANKDPSTGSARKIQEGSVPDTSKEKPIHLYQCANCQQILLTIFDSDNRLTLDNTIAFRIVRDVKKEYSLDIRSEEPLIASELDYDALCVFFPIYCKSCTVLIGKVYLSTTEQHKILKRDVPLLFENQIKIFDVRSCIQVVPPPLQGNTESKSPTESNKPNDKKPVSSTKADKADLNPFANISAIDFNPEGDQSKLFEVDSSFREMRGILSSFANLLEQFDMRLTNSEKMIRLMNDQISAVMKELHESSDDTS